jgi:hypothetical protein
MGQRSVAVGPLPTEDSSRLAVGVSAKAWTLGRKANGAASVTDDHPIALHGVGQYATVRRERQRVDVQIGGQTEDRSFGNAVGGPVGKPRIHPLSRPAKLVPGLGQGEGHDMVDGTGLQLPDSLQTG